MRTLATVCHSVDEDQLRRLRCFVVWTAFPRDLRSTDIADHFQEYTEYISFYADMYVCMYVCPKIYIRRALSKKSRRAAVSNKQKRLQCPFEPFSAFAATR